MAPRTSQHDLQDFCQACYDGDVEALAAMLDREDPIQGFQGDLNMHFTEYNPLHFAAASGHLDVVDALLAAGGIDPHMKTRVRYGGDPKEGKTAADLADDWGWDDVVAKLRDAEKKVPKGDYIMYGPMNNSKIYPVQRPMGRDPQEIRVVAAKLKAMRRPYFLEATERPGGAALLFPGQGSQCVAMLAGMAQLPKVQELLLTAKRVLGWDVLEVCLQGPASKLEQAEFAHPALLIAGLAALEQLRRENPTAAGQPGAVAGLGVGELTALVAAGVLSVEDGLLVAKARAAAIDEVAKGGHATLSVAGIVDEKLEQLCKQAGQCEIVHHLFPKGATVAGPRAAVEALEKLAKQNGAIQVKLSTGVAALHSSAMAPAAKKLEEVLEDVAPRMSRPKCDIYMNCTGAAVHAGTAPKLVAELFLRQTTEPVQWEKSVRSMIKQGYSDFYELGPMKQLKMIMKRIDATVFETTTSVEV